MGWGGNHLGAIYSDGTLTLIRANPDGGESLGGLLEGLGLGRRRRNVGGGGDSDGEGGAARAVLVEGPELEGVHLPGPRAGGVGGGGVRRTGLPRRDGTEWVGAWREGGLGWWRGLGPGIGRFRDSVAGRLVAIRALLCW